MDKTFGIRDPRLTYRDRPGAYLIDTTEGRLACVPMHLGYLLPGGGIEAGESREDCIRRECLEETGRTVTIGAPLCAADTYCMHHRLGPFHPIQYYYRGAIGSKVQEPTEPDHTFLWLPLAELSKLYVPQQIWAVRYALEQE